MNKRILITNREVKTPFRFDGRIYIVIRVLYPSVAKDLQPSPPLAYFVNPREPLDFDASQSYGFLISKICSADKPVLGIVRPGFLEMLTVNGYHELGKLRSFISEENGKTN